MKNDDLFVYVKEIEFHEEGIFYVFIIFSMLLVFHWFF